MSPGRPSRGAATQAGRHDLGVASTLTCADDAAAAGDYARAVGWLRVVEAIGDELPREYQTKRREWLEAAGACGRIGALARPGKPPSCSSSDATVRRRIGHGLA